MLANLQASLVRLWVAGDARECLLILRSLTLSIAPAVIASLVSPPRVCVLAVLISIVLCYRATSPIQSQLFTLRLVTAHALVAMPMQIFFAGWVLALLLLDRPGQLGTSLFSVCILTFTAIAPLFRSIRSTRTGRRLPYAVTYSLVSTLAIAVQVCGLWETP